jgi:hypothetical protein
LPVRRTAVPAYSFVPRLSAEVCDGLPSDVEHHSITSTEYCPWAGKVVAIE